MLQPSSSGRTGRDGMSPDAEIAAYVDSLSNLTARLDEGQVSQDDLELAMHQLEALRTFLWGGIDPMVRFCVPRMLPHGPEMHPEHMEDCLKTGCDEYVVKGHRLIMRRSLDDSAVSLTDLAKEVFNPKSKEYGDYRKRLRENILYPMRDIGLWDYVEGETKKSKTGNDYHTGFRITAGPVLMAFHRHIYMPWSKRYAKLACKLVSRMEN